MGKTIVKAHLLRISRLTSRFPFLYPAGRTDKIHQVKRGIGRICKQFDPETILSESVYRDVGFRRPPPPLLLHGASIDGERNDVAIRGGMIAAVASCLAADPDMAVIKAHDHALLPGLHDHHIHLNATAAALGSVRCGPPEVSDAASLALALNSAPGYGWLRGIGYHDSVAGEIDRAWLDRHGPRRPIRIQHRSGRMWIMNSLALLELGLDSMGDGRLLDRDGWLRERMPLTLTDLAPVGAYLASRGVTGLTEVTPRNGLADYRRLALAGLPQRMLIMGSEELNGARPLAKAHIGAVKLHYHDHDLPGLDELTRRIAEAHAADRAVASHCTTSAELMLTLMAIEEAGVMAGDRIEHGSIITPENAEWIARLGLTVVTQPHFLTERGDAYLADVEPDDLPLLYRLAGLKRAGIPLAGGSDAPFGSADPWQSMAAAVSRPAGFGEGEGLTPEEALALFTGTSCAPGAGARRIAPGEPADLCLLDRPWSAARRELASVEVRLTLVGGQQVYRAE
jgi:predicted amidohydrolase YtcJ